MTTRYSSIMTALISALSDIIKFQIIRNIDTGDKTLDSLIIVLLTVILSFISSWISAGIMTNLLSIYITTLSLFKRKNKNGPILVDNMYMYKHVNINEFKYWIKFNDRKKIEKILAWVYDNMPKYCSSSEISKTTIMITDLDSKSSNSIKKAFCDYDQQVYKSFKTIPVYNYDNSICYLHYDEVLYLVANELNVIEQFCEQIKKIGININDEQRNIFDTVYTKNVIDVKFISKLLPTKTFDCIVSKEKSNIINYLDRFVKGNLYGVDSGWIPNNLGILLYGEPGLGKTSIIKAICNYTERDIILVDIRALKSGSDLEKIIRTHGSKYNVIVLEEIDFMMDVLTRNNNNNNKNEDTKRSNIMSQIIQSSDEKLKEKLMDELKEHDNAKKIDLSLLLQLMDGVVESSDRLIIATTNCPDMIDKALLRPGRFDLVIKLNHFNRCEIIELLEKILKPTDTEKAFIMTQKIIENVWSPLEIVQLVLSCNKNILDIMKALSEKPIKRLQ